MLYNRFVLIVIFFLFFIIILILRSILLNYEKKKTITIERNMIQISYNKKNKWNKKEQSKKRKEMI